MLTTDDLAYMRATQADTRPTQAQLYARTETSDGMGGRTTAEAAPVLIQVRLHDPDDVPDDLADRYGTPALVKIVADLVPIASGDRVKALTTGESYQVVSEGDPGEWATAQVVWAVRL